MRLGIRALLLAFFIGVYAAVVQSSYAAAGRLPAWWVRSALCVHSHEGSWRDPAAPYYGGMQMDWSFMSHYGSWYLRRYGTADHWSPHVQLVVAYRGWRRQGWGAWPLSSRLCGLL